MRGASISSENENALACTPKRQFYSTSGQKKADIQKDSDESGGQMKAASKFRAEMMAMWVNGSISNNSNKGVREGRRRLGCNMLIA